MTTTSPTTTAETTTVRPMTDDEATDLIVDLVGTKSLSGAERPAVDVFVRRAAVAGFHAEIDAAGNGLAWRRATGETPAGEQKTIVLLGHIDTVPGDIPVRLEDGILHGRGSVDAKGPLASFLAGASRAELPDGVNLLVCAACGEEEESPGAHHLKTQLRPDACFIGEPSAWDGVTLGYKGSVRMNATVTRDNGHSAGPGDSACDYLIAWWQRVQQRVHDLNGDRTGDFDRILWSVRGIASNNDGLHDVGELNAGYRLPTWITVRELKDIIRDIDHDGVNLIFTGDEEAWRSPRNDAVARALTTAIRAEQGTPRPKVKTGTCDMNVVGPVWQCPIAAYGPGDSLLDHSPQEHLVIDEYHAAIRVVSRAIASLASELTASNT
jgi:LysW-gamma-L-lysine carboxypeptidase